MPPPLVACAPRSRGTTAPPAPSCSWRSCAPRSSHRRSKYRERVREAGRACVKCARARAGEEKQTAPKPSWKESEGRERAGSHALKQDCPLLHQDFISECSVFHQPALPHITASRFQPRPRRRVVVCRPQPAASASERAGEGVGGEDVISVPLLVIAFQRPRAES